MKFVRIILSILTFCLAPYISFGQTTDNPSIIPSNDSGELHSANVDTIRTVAQTNGERLFIIVRPGTVDTGLRVNNNRLRAIKNYIVRRGGFNTHPIVFAKGEISEGEGRIEYYLGSNLIFVMLAAKNKIPNLTCCDSYFPPIKRKVHKKRKKS